MKKLNKALVPVILLAAFAATSCRHRLETHSTIEPIHITIDVNVRVDRALDNYFSDLDSLKEGDATGETSDTTQTEESK